MSKFLDTQTLYRVFQRELPEGVYPDGNPSASFSAASIYSKAQVFETMYANLNRIYDNYWPQTADEKIGDWEITVFGQIQDASLSLDTRRQNVLTKIRAQPTITMWNILTLIAGLIPAGMFVQIAEFQCGSGRSWILGVSRFGKDTFLGWGSPNSIQGPDFCHLAQNLGWRLGQSALGLNTFLGSHDAGNLILAQNRAYGYEIRIFGNIDAATLNLINLEVTKAEPARSHFIIRTGLSLATYGLIFPVTDVGQFSGVDCITRDDTSTTGYSGMETL